METYSHNCLKCKTAYSDTDPDTYLCESCQKEKQSIAEMVDAKFGSTVGQQPNSELMAFDAIRKEKGVNFVNINDLGIKL